MSRPHASIMIPHYVQPLSVPLCGSPWMPVGEKVWRMPMEANYFEQLKSSCADMKNTGGR